MSDIGTTHPVAGTGARIFTFADDIDEHGRAEVAVLLEGWSDVLPAGSVDIAVLSGGANNRNFVVNADDVTYALRVANSLNDRMAVDRASAYRAQRDAARVGVAPDVVAHKSPEGHMLSQFMPGVALSLTTVHDPVALDAIAAAFKSLHHAPSTCRNFDPVRDSEMWIGFARSDETEVPAVVDELLELALGVENVIAQLDLPRVFCHNDTVPQNFLLDGNSVVLVDWDYAGMGYAAFELGSFACTADLTTAEAADFLRAYDPDLDAPALARVGVMQFLAGVREIAWVLNAAGILRGTTMVPDSFYDEYLENNVRRAVAFGLSADFPDLLDTATQRGRHAFV